MLSGPPGQLETGSAAVHAYIAQDDIDRKCRRLQSDDGFVGICGFYHQIAEATQNVGNGTANLVVAIHDQD